MGSPYRLLPVGLPAPLRLPPLAIFQFFLNILINVQKTKIGQLILVGYGGQVELCIGVGLNQFTDGGGSADHLGNGFGDACFKSYRSSIQNCVHDSGVEVGDADNVVGGFSTVFGGSSNDMAGLETTSV